MTPGTGVVAPTVPHTARRLARAVAEAGGGHVTAILLYGSQLLRASPDENSAWDLVVVVDRYAPYHRALVESGHHDRPPWVLTLAARVLPPYVTAFAPSDDSPVLAKCLVVSRKHFLRALRPRSPDHFLKGRLVQKVAVVWAADELERGQVDGLLEEARKDVLAWAGPFVDEPFDAADLTRRMLEVSYAGELRPEAGDRVLEVYRSQRDWLVAEYSRILAELVSAGRLVPVGDPSTPAPEDGAEDGALVRYRFVRRPGALARWRVRGYFLRSKARATLRWFKYVVTFNDWLGYIVKKVERRVGITVEITPAERRFPLILLWPKVFRVLRVARRQRLSSGEGD